MNNSKIAEKLANTLGVSDVKTLLWLSEACLEVDVQFALCGHDDSGVVLHFTREPSDDRALGRVSVPDENVITVGFQVQVLNLLTEHFSFMSFDFLSLQRNLGIN